MTRRVVEKLCTIKVCFDFLAPKSVSVRCVSSGLPNPCGHPTAMLWELCSVMSVEEWPKRNCFGNYFGNVFVCKRYWESPLTSHNLLSMSIAFPQYPLILHDFLFAPNCQGQILAVWILGPIVGCCFAPTFLSVKKFCVFVFCDLDKTD